MATRKLATYLLGALIILTTPACALANPPAVTASPSATKQPATTDDQNAETFRLLKLFASVFERVRSQYVEPVEDKELVEAAINGMLTHLDPHSVYMNSDEWKDMQVETRGEFGGLGIEVTMENGLVKVISPIDDTPASRAGMRAGDLVVELDGKAVMGLTLQEAVNKMRGPAGTKITLTVARQGAGEPLRLTLTRAVIRVESVKWRAEGKIGYIRIAKFNERTQDGLNRAVSELKKQIGPDLQGWVVDLRNNPGGLLEQAVSVADSFLEQGEIVSTRARNPDDTQKIEATPGDIADGKPMVVLINVGSASASEIVAGALQDHHRAIVLGVKSFGKGSVQTVVPLPGYGAMKLTTARYYTPSGRSIQAEGIVPDITVQPAKVEVIDESKGFNIRESSLPGALNNDHPAPNNAPPAMAPPATTPEAEPAPKPESTAPGADPAKPAAVLRPGELAPEEDFQLARGLDLIHGLWVFSQQGQQPQTPPQEASAAPAPPSPPQAP